MGEETLPCNTTVNACALITEDTGIMCQVELPVYFVR